MPPRVRGSRLFEFVAAVEGLPVRPVEFSSLVPPARRAAHLAEFRSGRAQVATGPSQCAGLTSAAEQLDSAASRLLREPPYLWHAALGKEASPEQPAASHLACISYKSSSAH